MSKRRMRPVQNLPSSGFGGPAVQHMQHIPEEQQLLAATILNQQDLATALLELTPSQNLFLRMRLMCTTDTEARHLAGHRPVPRSLRGDQQPTRQSCKCFRELENWVDVREDTLLGWKKEALFRRVYDTMLHQPVLYSSTRLEQLSSMAVGVYEAILSNPEETASVRRLAAKDVLTMNGLMVGDGQQHAENSIASSMSFLVAKERWIRGMELNQAQKDLLVKGGVNLALPPPKLERTLDGDDEVEGEFRELPETGEGAAPAGGALEDSAESPAADVVDDDDARDSAERNLEVRSLEDEDAGDAETSEPPRLSELAISALPAAWR